jgi:hypothetical protein
MMSEIRQFLEQHLQSIFDCDLDGYHDSTAPDLSLYEWYVTPHRIDGLPFHDFMMTEAARPDSASLALDPLPQGESPSDKRRTRFDLANYREQAYGEVVICSYTLLVSRGSDAGVSVRSHNESRVLVRLDGRWKIVHVHKSPAWAAPFAAPG